MNTTYARRPYTAPEHTQTAQKPQEHPVQGAITTLVENFEDTYKVSLQFIIDEDSMRLFKRGNNAIIGFICNMYDERGKCLSQGRGLSFIGYPGEKYVQRAILYARNASLIDCAMRASKMTILFDGDDKEQEGSIASEQSYRTPSVEKPSDKQLKYLNLLIEGLSSDEQSTWMSRLPQMTKYDVSQAINSLKA